MADLTLYHASPSRSSIVLWMLEELGQPYDVHLVSFKKGENLKPEYLAINPMGKVPALKHRDVVVTEVAAICTYLADRSEEHTSELQSRENLVCRLLLEKKNHY